MVRLMSIEDRLRGTEWLICYMRQAAYAATSIYSLHECKSIVQPSIGIIREFLLPFFLPLLFVSGIQIMSLIIGLQRPSSSSGFPEQ